MNLTATILLYAGGLGSGCQGPNCGRPVTKQQWKEMMQEHNAIKNHRLRSGGEGGEVWDRQYKMQRIRLGGLADTMQRAYGNFSRVRNARNSLDQAETHYANNKMGKALDKQEDALMSLHRGLEEKSRSALTPKMKLDTPQKRKAWNSYVKSVERMFDE